MAESASSANKPYSIPQDSEDPVLAALLDIKVLINKMDTRVSLLEKSSSLATHSAVHPTELPGVPQNDMSPRHTLASAILAPSSGTSFIPLAAADSCELKKTDFGR